MAAVVRPVSTFVERATHPIQTFVNRNIVEPVSTFVNRVTTQPSPPPPAPPPAPPPVVTQPVVGNDPIPMAGPAPQAVRRQPIRTDASQSAQSRLAAVGAGGDPGIAIGQLGRRGRGGAAQTTLLGG